MRRNVTVRPVPDEGGESHIAKPYPTVGAKQLILERRIGVCLNVEDEEASKGGVVPENDDGFDSWFPR
jgi:hypothetical protein